MSSHPDLRLDWCSYAAAKYAVEKWHYSRVMPRPKNVFIGAWENSYIGAIVFGLGGGNAANGRRFGLQDSFEVAELERVALKSHRSPVSRIVSIAIRMLRKQSPGIRLIVSYADPLQGHNGAIYQAGNWLYLGQTGQTKMYVDSAGKQHHERVVSRSGLKKHYGQYKSCLRPQDAAEIIDCPGKYLYVYPLDDGLRLRLADRAQPYPKRAGSIGSDASAIHAEEGGASPTSALQLIPDPSIGGT